jgi:thiamine-phosphate pyrophosphorylase
LSPLPSGLYALADSQFGQPFRLAVALAAAGARLIQVRAKGWSISALLEADEGTCRSLVDQGVCVVINDHIEVAAALGASGVHLGQDDASPEAARRALGPSALIGLSTHDLDQVRQATDVDYLGFGPVFSTRTKVNPGDPRGLNTLVNAIRATPLPVIAIGGISKHNLDAVRNT